MDQIAFVEDGRVVEQGGHERLLRARGRYADFWTRRTGAPAALPAEAGKTR
jgi:ATP-binding cassette subfamily B protein